jgi:hypothetical protein
VILVIGGVVLAMVRYLVDLLLFFEIEKLNEKNDCGLILRREKREEFDRVGSFFLRESSRVPHSKTRGVSECQPR